MKNGTLKFLPLLLLYLFMVIMLSSTTFLGDENSYAAFASRLSQGYYSPNNGISLWFGPGYPIVLVPFAYLKLPWLVAKLLNAMFLFGAILYFYKTLALWLQETYSLIFTFVMGLYPPFLRAVHLLLTENLVFFLGLIRK